MNWFMVVIGILQFLAALYYAARGQYSFSALIFLYGVTNFILFYQGER